MHHGKVVASGAAAELRGENILTSRTVWGGSRFRLPGFHRAGAEPATAVFWANQVVGGKAESLTQKTTRWGEPVLNEGFNS